MGNKPILEQKIDEPNQRDLSNGHDPDLFNVNEEQHSINMSFNNAQRVNDSSESSQKNKANHKELLKIYGEEMKRNCVSNVVDGSDESSSLFSSSN